MIYTLAWSSYNENSTELEGAVVGAYSSLAEAQHCMEEEITETIEISKINSEASYEGENKATISFDNGFCIIYYIQEIPFFID